MKTKTERPGLIKSALRACARWAGIPIDAGDGSAYNLGDSRLFGQDMSTTSALQLSAVWACVSLLSDTISTLPLGFYEKTATGRKAAVDHPLFRVLRRQPNADMTSAQLIGATVATMLLRDAAYWEKLLSAGRVIGVNFLARDCLAITCGPDGKKQYRYTENGKTRELPADRVVKLIGFSLNGKDGLSAIKYACNVFGAAKAAEKAASGTFWRGLLQTIYFKFPTILKKDQRDDARAMIESVSGAVNAGRPVVLEGGMEAGNIGINPQDAQLLESRAFSVEEICSWFRVQPFMIGRASKGQTNWGTGIEQQMIGFITFTLAPWLRRIEQTIEKDLLRPDEKGKFYAEFALDGLLRGDSASRREFYASALNNGWMNRNQVRALENMDPLIDGGDIYTVQSALVPLDQLGAEPPPDQIAADALKRWLGFDQKDTPQ